MVGVSLGETHGHDEDTYREPGLAHTSNLDQSMAERDLINPGIPTIWGGDLEEQCDDEGVDTDREPPAHPEHVGGSYGAR